MEVVVICLVDPNSHRLLWLLNREIRRRTCVVKIFLNADSYVRLVTTYLLEYAEDWSVSRVHRGEKLLKQCR